MIDAQSEHRLRVLAADSDEDVSIAALEFAASERTTQDKLRLLAVAEQAMVWRAGMRWLQQSRSSSLESAGDSKPTQPDTA